MNAATDRGTHLAHSIVPMNHSEKREGPRLLRDKVAPVVAPFVNGRPFVGVVTTDAAFSTFEMRSEVRNMGYLENISSVSHANEERAEKLAAEWIPFEDHEAWGSNGLREINCIHGTAKRTKRVSKNRGQTVVATRVEVECTECGNFTVTSGEWYLADNPRRWRRRDPSDTNPSRRPDLGLGNGLTYYDRVAGDFSANRFHHHEGFHGALSTRFKLTQGKRYFKTIDQARIEAAMVFTIMHACGIESRRKSTAQLAA